MRTYSKIDMIRYAKLCKENPNLKPWEQIKLYDETVKELTPKERLFNLFSALGMKDKLTKLEKQD